MKGIALSMGPCRRIWLPISICLDLSASFAIFDFLCFGSNATDERLLLEMCLLVPNMVCEGNKTAPVMVKNPTEDFITLKKGYPIGLGIEVLTVANDDQIEPECNFKLNKIDIEKHSSELAEVEKQ